MRTILDLCFLCTKDSNCVLADDRIVSQVEYLLPEITIIKLGIPLRICSICDGALCAFNKFKQSSVESSRRLEARIKGAQGPPLHTGSPPVVDDSEASGAKPEKMEEIFIKEEYVEETPLDTRMNTDRAFLDPINLVETIIAEPHNQLHKDRVSQNIQLHTDTNADNIEEISIKKEQIEEIPQGREFYNDILNEECVSNSMNDDTDRQPEQKLFTQNASSTTDIENHSGVKDFQCKICAKSFTQKHSLTTHIKSHSGVKDFQCEICEKSFTQKPHLTSHLKTHSAVKEFQCEICEKSFTFKNALNYHMKLHSGIKDFRCEICNKSFTLKFQLTSHIKMHSGVKDFKCEICEKSFLRKAHLTTHMKIHANVFKCYICNEIFQKKCDLTKHLRTHLELVRI